MIGTGPYDSLREYLEAIEEHGKLIRIDEIDQDAYELTGFIYKLMDKHGWLGAPAVIVEKVKIDGEWMDGPILINQYGMSGHEALAIGVPLEDIDWGDHVLDYKTSVNEMMGANEGFFRASVSYTGDTVSAVQPSSQYTQRSYKSIDLKYGLMGDDWEVNLFINNVSDERADIAVNDWYFDFFFGNARQYVNRPREVGVRYVKRW